MSCARVLELNRKGNITRLPVASCLNKAGSLRHKGLLVSFTIMADKEATVYIVDIGKSMGECHNGRSVSDLEWAMQYVWDRITTTVSKFILELNAFLTPILIGRNRPQDSNNGSGCPEI